MKNANWSPIVSRRVTVFRSFATSKGSKDSVQEYIGCGCNYLTITKNELTDVYLATPDIQKLSGVIIKRIQTDASFPARHADDCRRGCEKFVMAARAAGKKVKNATNETLAQKCNEFYRAYVCFAKFMAIPVAIEYALTAQITTALTGRVGARASEYLVKLMASPAYAEFQLEQIDLLKLALAKTLQKNGALNKHIESYRWLSCYNIDEPAYTAAYFLERLAELREQPPQKIKNKLHELESQLDRDEHVYQETMRELKLDKATEGVVKLLRQYVYLRTYRVEMQSKANYYVQPLFAELASRCGLTLRLTLALTPLEIGQSIFDHKKIPHKDALEERCREYGLRYDDNGIFFVTGATAVQTLEDNELGRKNTNDTGKLTGTVAYGGIATGLARVVITKDDIRNFQAGEILVTTMTTPEFVPAMKKAVAIVTNEGGVLCHAAIIARELKVPCIIATARATRMFTTGDRLQVDAEKGIVQKIN